MPLDTPSDPSAMLTVAQAAARLGVSARKVYDLADSGDLPCYRMGRSVRIAEDDVTEYLAQCRFTATKRKVAGALSLTAASLAKEGSALENAFRKLGLAPKLTPSTAKKPRASTPSQAERNGLRLVSKTP